MKVGIAYEYVYITAKSLLYLLLTYAQSSSTKPTRKVPEISHEIGSEIECVS